VLARDPQNVLAWSGPATSPVSKGTTTARRRRGAEPASSLRRRNPPSSSPICMSQPAASMRRCAVLDPVAERDVRRRAYLHARCQAHAGLRDWPSLRRSVNRGRTDNPRSVDAWRHLAQRNFEQGRQREAIDAFLPVCSSVEPRMPEDLNYVCGPLPVCAAVRRGGSGAEAGTGLDPGNASTLTQPGPDQHVSREILRFGERRPPGDQSRSEARPCVRCAQHPACRRAGRCRARGGVDNGAKSRNCLRTAVSRRPSSGRTLWTAQGEVDTAFAAYRDAHELAMVRDRSERRAYDAVGEEVFEQSLVDQAAGAHRRPVRRAAARGRSSSSGCRGPGRPSSNACLAPIHGFSPAGSARRCGKSSGHFAR
jgi:hypothetical protein